MIGNPRRLRRLAAAFFAAVMVLSIAPLASIAQAQTAEPPAPQDTSTFCQNVGDENPFTDLSSDNVHYENILCLVAAEITQGTTATTYSPGEGVRRDQMASFIARLIDTANELETGDLQDLPAHDGENDFPDVTSDNVHLASINRLADAGVVLGKTDGNYDPAEIVKRDQMGSFINRALDYLVGPDGDAITTEDDFFADDDGNVHEDNINDVASAGIYVGTTAGDADPRANTRRDQMGSFLTRANAELEEQGLITPLPGDTNQSFMVTTEDDTIVELNDGGTYPADPGDEVTFTVSGLEAGEAYDLALFTTGDERRGPSIATEDGIVSFRDQDLDDLADDTGTTYDDGHIFISAYGTAFDFTDTAGVGTRHVNDATADSNGEIRVVLETDGAGDSANLVVWDDANADDQLNLVEDSTDSFNQPAESFAVSDIVAYHFGEAPSGYSDGTSELVYVDKAQQFVIEQAGGYAVFYDDNDNYTYDNHDFSVPFSQVQDRILQIGDEWDIDGYSPTGSNTFDFDDDTPGIPVDVSVAAGDFDEEADGEDVQVSWVPPTPEDGLISQYEIYRLDATDLTIETSVGTTAFENNFSGVATTFVEEEVPAGDWLYRVEAISRSGDEGDKSLLSGPITIEGPPGPTIESADLTTDTVTVDAADTGDVWTLQFNEDMAVPGAGDTLTLTDADGDLILVDCTGAAAADNTTDATCAAGATADTITVTLAEDATDRNAGGDGEILYPLTITNTDGWVDATDGTAVDLAASTDVTIG